MGIPIKTVFECMSDKPQAPFSSQACMRIEKAMVHTLYTGRIKRGLM